MSTALTVQPRGEVRDKYDDVEVLATIKQTICKGATDAQLKMFIEVCRGTGLNPWLKEIWYVPSVGIMAGRDGYLRVANEHPMFDGIETRVERDENNVPIKATCTVWRKDRGHPTICEAFYSEYKKGGGVWAQYPSAMIGKVAEVLALKRSFSINGVVAEEEIGRQEEHPHGSKEAAQAVAEKKLADFRAAGKISEVLQAEYVDVPSETGPAPDFSEAAELHADIVAHPPKATKATKPYDKFAMLEAMGVLKKRFQVIGQEPEYYRVLGAYGAEKSNQLPTSDDGTAARACYKEMSLCVADLEAAHALKLEANKEPAPPVTGWAGDGLPLPEIQSFSAWHNVCPSQNDESLGLAVRVNGKLYRRENTAQTWTVAK